MTNTESLPVCEHCGAQASDVTVEGPDVVAVRIDHAPDCPWLRRGPFASMAEVRAYCAAVRWIADAAEPVIFETVGRGEGALILMIRSLWGMTVLADDEARVLCPECSRMIPAWKLAAGAAHPVGRPL